MVDGSCTSTYIKTPCSADMLSTAISVMRTSVSTHLRRVEHTHTQSSKELSLRVAAHTERIASEQAQPLSALRVSDELCKDTRCASAPTYLLTSPVTKLLTPPAV